ncbi:uncharacterized protein LOC130900726 [Diorhabda carinulata]|uniref:uncharacterized protein LOC130900726 n=1 Tax=Diorhabda carinulata TaxID=1163345 RepID=UPI0025A2987D|nr:uncharacterized protein LOC130900726 [Diorhabda carinulata]
MVNSGTFDTNAIGQGDRNAKVNRAYSDVEVSPESVNSTNDGDVSASAHSNDESTPDDETSNKNLVADDDVGTISDEEKGTLCCSVPLDKVQGVLTPFSTPKVDDQKPTRKLLDLKRKDVVRMTFLCLYCERSFASANLRQKHVERIHSIKKNRRLSSRKQNQMTVTPCFYCEKLNTTENTLKDLFQHLVNEHSDKYFGCLQCEERFFTNSLLSDHNTLQHPIAPSLPEKIRAKDAPIEDATLDNEVTVKLTRSKTKPKTESTENSEPTKTAIRSKNAKLKDLRSKKLTVKSSRIALNRRESKRLQAISDAQKKKRQKPVERGKQTAVNKTEPAPEKSSCINPYPEFDHFYRVKKITDHSIDNLKISSLTFDDVFDKTFFNRIKCNIEENLLHHIDGKLFKNEESENRISNFEKVSTVHQEIQNSAVENFGCELTLNAVTPVASLSLNSQYGEDFESQIEYGAKPSKKKAQTKKDEVHYKYFTRRKFQASILEQTENRDLSKLDMWTQLVIKKRQQKIIDDKKTAKEIQEYTACDEYKNKIRREELNRILDRRGPFEDLREEASKKAALDKLNSDSEDSISHESFTEVREVLNEILNRVFNMTEKIEERDDDQVTMIASSQTNEPDLREIPSFLNLRRKSSLPNDGEIDQSDKITLICSSQETENFELPTNPTRGKDELIELSGEWARCRMYICAACGAKLPNMRYLLDHKTIYHQNVWVQHYEFVGNQSELYRHLSIPALGKVGFIENNVQCKSWKRSDARTCTKCKKQCNTLGELHRHILECGGDWTWMLARKKCKYRYGAKSRRKRRGLVVRMHHHKRKTDSTEKKKYKYDGPRQRPSDAETIQRMLANLPAKRSTRKLISLYDGVRRKQKNKELEKTKQKKVKCGKVIYSKSSNIKETTEKTINTQKSNQTSNIRSMRSLNRVLSSKILDTTTTLSVKRKLKVLNERRRTRQSVLAENNDKNEHYKKDSEKPSSSPQTRKKLEKTEINNDDTAVKKTPPRSTKLARKLAVKKLLTGNINIKSFFPVKKRKNKKESKQEATPNVDIKTRSKTRTSEPEDDNNDDVDQPKTKKNNKLNNIVSINKKKTSKKASQEVAQKYEQELSKKPANKELDLNKRKRNLKQSFRNVINRVKRLKIDNASEKVQTDNNKSPLSKSPFLDEPKQEKDPVKIVIPSTMEAKENIADISETAHTVITFNETNEDSPVPENIFKLDSNNEKNLQAKGEPNFDSHPLSVINTDTTVTELVNLPASEDPNKLQPISIETSVKPKTLPMISPNLKGKIRKPARGLNDCIAMLTSKLQQKSCENVSQPKQTLSPAIKSPKTVTDPSPPKTECILKIPTFKTQNETCEEVALDLSIKPRDKVTTDVQKSLPAKSTESPWQFNRLTSVERIIENVVNNKLQEPQKVKLPTPCLFNSIDRTIQNVIDGHLKQQNMQTRTTVDDIIDYVVNIDKSKIVSNQIVDVKNLLSSLKQKGKCNPNITSVIEQMKTQAGEDAEGVKVSDLKTIIETELTNKITVPKEKVTKKAGQVIKSRSKRKLDHEKLLPETRIDEISKTKETVNTLKVPIESKDMNNIPIEDEPCFLENKTVSDNILSTASLSETLKNEETIDETRNSVNKQNLRNFRKQNKTIKIPETNLNEVQKFSVSNETLNLNNVEKKTLVSSIGNVDIIGDKIPPVTTKTKNNDIKSEDLKNVEIFKKESSDIVNVVSADSLDENTIGENSTMLKTMEKEQKTRKIPPANNKSKNLVHLTHEVAAGVEILDKETINDANKIKSNQEVEDGDIEAQIEITIIGKCAADNKDTIGDDKFDMSLNGINKKQIRRFKKKDKNQNKKINNEVSTSILEPSISDNIQKETPQFNQKESEITETITEIIPKKRGRKPKKIRQQKQKNQTILPDEELSDILMKKDSEENSLSSEKFINNENILKTTPVVEDTLPELSKETKVDSLVLETKLKDDENIFSKAQLDSSSNDSDEITDRKPRKGTKKENVNHTKDIEDSSSETINEHLQDPIVLESRLKSPTKRPISPKKSKILKDVNSEDIKVEQMSKTDETKDLLEEYDSTPVRLTRSKSPKKLTNKLQELDGVVQELHKEINEDNTITTTDTNTKHNTLCKDLSIEINLEGTNSRNNIKSLIEFGCNKSDDTEATKKEIKTPSKRSRKKAINTVDELNLDKIGETNNLSHPDSSKDKLETKVSNLEGKTKPPITESDICLKNNENLNYGKETNSSLDNLPELMYNTKIDSLKTKNLIQQETIVKPKGKKRGRKPKSLKMSVNNLNAEKLVDALEITKELQIVPQNEDLKIKLTKRKRGRKPKALKQDTLNVQDPSLVVPNDTHEVLVSGYLETDINNKELVSETITAMVNDGVEDFPTPEQSEDSHLNEPIKTLDLQKKLYTENNVSKPFEDVVFSQQLKNLSVTLENFIPEQITSNRLSEQFIKEAIKRSAYVERTSYNSKEKLTEKEGVSLENNIVEDKLPDQSLKPVLKVKISPISDVEQNNDGPLLEENKSIKTTRVPKSPKKLLISLNASIETVNKNEYSNNLKVNCIETTSIKENDLVKKSKSSKKSIETADSFVSEKIENILVERDDLDRPRQTNFKSLKKSTKVKETTDTTANNNLQLLQFPELGKTKSLSGDDVNEVTHYKDDSTISILSVEGERRLRSPRKSKILSNSMEKLNADSGFDNQRLTPRRKLSKSLKNISTNMETKQSDLIDQMVKASGRSKMIIESEFIQNDSSKNVLCNLRRTRSSTNILMSSNESISKLNDTLDAEVCNILSQSEFNSPDLKLNRSKSRSSSLRKSFDSPSMTEVSEPESVSPNNRIKRLGRRCKKYFTSEESIDKLDLAETKSSTEIKIIKSTLFTSLNKRDVETKSAPLFNSPDVDFVKPITGRKSNNSKLVTNEESFKCPDFGNVDLNKHLPDRKCNNSKLSASEEYLDKLESEEMNSNSDVDFLQLLTNKKSKNDNLSKIDVVNISENIDSDSNQLHLNQRDVNSNNSSQLNYSLQCSETDTSDVKVLEEKIRNAIRQSLLSSINTPDSHIESSDIPNSDTKQYDDHKISEVNEIRVNSSDFNTHSIEQEMEKPKKIKKLFINNNNTLEGIDNGSSSRSLRKKSVINYAEQEETKELIEDDGINNNNNNECKDSQTSETKITDTSNNKNISHGLEENQIDEVKDNHIVEEQHSISVDESENYILKENLSKNSLLTTNNGVNKNRTKLKAKKGRKKIIKNKLTIEANIEDKIESKNDNVSLIAENVIASTDDAAFLTTIPPLADTSEEKEPPIKIIINKQKARRKSKNIKKVGEKGHNDLFEDFSLVIKKKRIITFSPPDTFSKEDTYPMETHQVSKPPVEISDKDCLNDSVQEMDMELDEIPIETSIIETPKLDLTLHNNYDTKDVMSLQVEERFSNSIPILFQSPKTIGRKKKSKRNSEENVLNQQDDLEDTTISEFKLPLLKISTKLNKAEQIYEEDRIFPDIINSTQLNTNEEETEKFETNLEFDESVKISNETTLNFVEPVVIRRLKKIKKKKIKNHISVEKSNQEDNIITNNEENNLDKEVDDLEIPSSDNLKQVLSNPFEEKEPRPEPPVLGELNKTTVDEEKEVEKYVEDEIPNQFVINESETTTIKVSKKGKKKGGRRKSRSKISSFDKYDTDITEDANDIFKDMESNNDDTDVDNSKLEDDVTKLLKNPIPCYMKLDDVTREEIDNIYAFSETEDFELEKPIDLPRRLPRKNDSVEKLKDQEHVPIKDSIKRKQKPKIKESVCENSEKDQYLNGEVKEDAVVDNFTLPILSVSDVVPLEVEKEIKDGVTDVEVSGGRKSMRTAKVKALEHIHDEALAELTDMDINKKSIKDTKNLDNINKKTRNKKKNEKPNNDFDFQRKVLNTETPLLEDLVAELNGFEELDNSIERELRAEMTPEELEKESKVIQNKVDEMLVNQLVEEGLETTEENQELRRSRRGSRKVASYNENDLIDPLIDAIESKRKGRKKDDKSIGDTKQKKGRESDRKLNSDELFDLLKASTNDNIYVPKQQNSFLSNIEDSSRDVNDENFDNMFENMLEKSAFLTEEKFISRCKNDIGNIYDFTKNDSLIEDEINGVKKFRKIPVEIEPIFTNHDSNSESKSKSDSFESNYCEICHKSFVKLENLIKHRRTLTHIQKLSELEAREAEKSKIISRHEDENSRESVIEPPSLIQSSEEIEKANELKNNELEIKSPNQTFSTNSSLKLADIINDVLTKPVLPTIEKEPNQFSDLILQNNDTKRYKSLGERKSFDSDTLISTDTRLTEPFESKTQILEKQISLLENIIENQTAGNYIDDISLSSEKSDIPSEPRSPSVSKPASDNNSFLKPVQYEEISEDSTNLRNYDDPKLRKTLNRDEELFLECCSLLKSSSEVSSSYSNKKMQEKVVGALGLKPIDEPEWLEKKNFIQDRNLAGIDDYSNNSRIPTPLGDSYDDDASNSNTISSNWGIDQSLEENQEEVSDVRLTFENISKNHNEKCDDIRFDGILSSTRSDQLLPDNTSSPKTSNDEFSDGSCNETKRMMTKGARKVFEGLKVSIPTEELNLEEVLNYSPKQKKSDQVIDVVVEIEKPLMSPTQKSRNSRKSKPVKKAQVGSNLLFKVSKKKLPSPSIHNKEFQKDVYDFEETQDNTDAFNKPDFKAFRTLKNTENESEAESRDLQDVNTVNTTTIPVSLNRKPKAQENITKKKCMIMGRIFKNAAKSKVEDIDEEIRSIPAIANEELVENYVRSQSTLTFDDVSDQQLDVDREQKQPEKPKVDNKKQENKKKMKLKGKKRARPNSESTDDEFSLNKTTKRRSNKKNIKEEDNVINLEQELKECIGVASRKSQRKCTSGKQNVLVEYWSSDDSQFEALLEKQIIEVKPREKPIEKQVIETPTEQQNETVVDELPPVDNIKKPLEVKKVKKKSTSGKKKPKTQETTVDGVTVNRRKRAAVNPLYHWSSSSEDEASDLIEIKPLRDELEDDEDRPVQHGWIVGDSPKKLVTMLAQAKGKKSDIDCVKEQGKKRTNTVS